MCILCEIQKWSRRVCAMLPWLVIPLIGLWALSQLLPPALRFEITSPRLACVSVLLVTLCWYEFLMPQLSAWQVRRNARVKERMRFEAIEMQKLKKTATRRCRNCLNTYRDQNPGGGKFMCSYCGHISKRPVLDLPVPPGMGNSGILKDLVGKGGKILNGKAWSDNGWMCGQDWLENGTWIGGASFVGKSSYWKSCGGLFGGDDDHCLTEKSYSRFFVFVIKAFTAFFLCIMWLWRKVFRVSSSIDEASADAERRGMLDNRGESGGTCQESRGEKARRKAEEKRQARLEKELLEEEERKQREEVARLVEERRKLRDEKTEVEKEHGKRSPLARERESKKEAERKRKKERDRGSSKSNSSTEELEKRAGKDSDKREQHRSVPESVKTHGTEVGYGYKGAGTINHNRGNAGTRYLDRMRGTFLSSSRAFTGGGFFGKSYYNNNTVSREQKSNTVVDHAQTSINRKEIVQPDRTSGKSNSSVIIEPQPCVAAPKKSWQQLFTRTPASSPPSNSNVISRPTVNHQEAQNPPFSSHSTSTTQSFDNPINYGLPSPFGSPSFSCGSSSGTVLPLSCEASFPKIGDSPRQFLPEESEIFEEPCYVPDPMSLLGPVSESLDSFQLDLGFVTNTGLEKPRVVKTVGAPSELTKPSPIESPLSRSRVSEERHSSSFFSPNSTTAQETCNSVNDTGTYQMWNTTSPLGQDAFGIVGGPPSWLLSPEMNLPKREDIIHHQVPQKTMASLFKKEEQVISGGTIPPQNILFGNCQNGGTFSTPMPTSVDSQWLPQTLFGPPTFENQILLKPKEGAAQNGLIYGNSGGPAANHQFVLSTANSPAKKEWTGQGPRDGVGSSPIGKPHIGGLYSAQDVQSVWSYV